MPKLNPAKDTLAFTRGDLFLYVGIGLLAFGRCLFLGQAYFDNDLLAQFGPWRDLLRDQLSQGHFPLWNPYSLGGQPFFADLQNMMAYPVNYLTLFFPVPYGLSVFFFLHLLWSSIGTHLWLRSLGLTRSISRVGALMFAFSGFFWLELIHPPVLAAFSWLPWIFLALESLVKDPKPRTGFYAGLSFAMLFLCGSFQVTLGAFYGCGLYFFFRALTKYSLKKFPWKRMAYALLLMVWGGMPLLVQWIPTEEFSAQSERRAAPLPLESLDPHMSLRPGTLYQLFLPRFSLPAGKSMAEAVQSPNTSDHPGCDFLAGWGYLGVMAPFFIPWVLRHRARKLMVFTGLFVLGALALSLGRYLPFHRWVFELVPGFSLIRVPFRFIYLYVIGTVVLASFGLQEFLTYLSARKNSKKGLLIFTLYTLVIGGIAFLRPIQDWREITACSASLAALTLYVLVPAWKKRVLPLFLASLILPLFLTAQGDFIPNPSSNFDFEKNSKSVPILARSVLPNRVSLDTRHMLYPIENLGGKYLIAFPENASGAMGFKNFGGYNPLCLLARAEVNLFPFSSVVKIGALEGILSDMGHGPLPGFKLRFSPPYYFYHYEKPILHVFAPGAILAESDRPRRLQFLSRPEFDPYQSAVLSEPIPPDIHTRIPKLYRPHVRYRTEKDECDLQRFSLELDQFSLVIFTETMFPGWKVWVDGESARIFTADHLLRSVFMPAGKHEVEFRFEPRWWKPILFSSFVWIFLTLVYFLYPKPRKVSRA